MISRITTLIPALCLCLCACTSLEPHIGPKPIPGYDLVDMAKIDGAQYDKDYEACVVIANQDVTNAMRVASNAVGTAADRASLGILGYRANKDADRVSVLKRCLTGRGYNVLR